MSKDFYSNGMEVQDPGSARVRKSLRGGTYFVPHQATSNLPAPLLVTGHQLSTGTMRLHLRSISSA